MIGPTYYKIMKRGKSFLVLVEDLYDTNFECVAIEFFCREDHHNLDDNMIKSMRSKSLSGETNKITRITWEDGSETLGILNCFCGQRGRLVMVEHFDNKFK